MDLFPHRLLLAQIQSRCTLTGTSVMPISLQSSPTVVHCRKKNRDHTTTKADMFLAGIASQLTVIVAYAMNCPQYIRSLKPYLSEKIFNCHNTYLRLLKYAQNLMINVNSETVLNNDRFSLLI